MAPIIRLTDPDDDTTVLQDLSSYVEGEGLDFPAPSLERVESSSFIRSGVFEGASKHGTRDITIPIVIDAGSPQASLDIWRTIIRYVDQKPALEVRLVSGGTSVWFDLLRSPSVPRYRWQHFGQGVLEGTLELVAQPYARGAESTLSVTFHASGIANSPEGQQYADIAASQVLGDIESPATIETVFTTTPNRLYARFSRRTEGTITNLKTLYTPGDTLTFAGPDIEDSVSFAETVNPSDKTGLVQVYAIVADADSVAGRYAMRVELTLGASGTPKVGDETVPVHSHLSTSTQYEVVFLGSFRIPENPAPSQWTWRVVAYRLVGTANVKVDRLLVLPVEESYAAIDWTAASDISGSTDKTFTLDTARRLAWWGTSSTNLGPAGFKGRGLWLKPGVDNRIIVQHSSDTATPAKAIPEITADPITSMTVKVRPRFLWVR